MDTLVTQHRFERQDLSQMIALQDGPVRPLLQAQTMRNGQTVPAIGVVPARGETHYWTEQGLGTAGGATAIDGASYGTGGALTEQMIRDLAKAMAKKNTPYRPNLLLVTADQAEVINSFHPQIITMANEGLVGGSSTDTYNTGVSKVQ